MSVTDVVKRDGARVSEEFNHAKLHASVRAACLSVRSPEGEAETVAAHVSDIVANWAKEKSAVTSNDLRRIATAALAHFHPEAAYLYQNHRLVV